MPAQNRISRAEFKSMRGFRRVVGRFFSLSWGTIAGRRTPGAAVVVSKKIASRAVVRNRIKRRARAILTEEVRAWPSPTLFVLIAKKGAQDALLEDVRADIHALVARTQSSR